MNGTHVEDQIETAREHVLTCFWHGGIHSLLAVFGMSRFSSCVIIHCFHEPVAFVFPHELIKSGNTMDVGSRMSPAECT
jgi:hypothetical protein